jgi:hypothetical protein
VIYGMRQGVAVIFFSVGCSRKRRYAKSFSKISAPELAFLANDRLKKVFPSHVFSASAGNRYI